MYNAYFFARRFFCIIYLVTKFLLQCFFDNLVNRDAPLVQPVRLAQLFLNLGATFIKFGQILAMRPDYLPEEYCNELLKLVDEVPPFDSGTAKAIIKFELKSDPEDLFLQFDDTPLAAASFGQVHRATLRTNEQVVVKVQRPNIFKIVNTDLRLLGVIIVLLDNTVNLGGVKLRQLLEEFRLWTLEELDYVKEACYAEGIGQNAVTNPPEKIPRVHWQYVTKRILVLEFLEGVWLKDLLMEKRKGGLTNARHYLSVQLPGADIEQVAKNLAHNLFSQIFVHGLFHADPHAGNLIILNDSSIGYVDFGITGRMSEGFRRKNLRFISALSAGNVDSALKALLDILELPLYVDIRKLGKQLKENINNWLLSQYDQRGLLENASYEALRGRSVARLVLQNVEVIRKYGFALPDIVARYYRTLAVVDVLVLELAPSVDFRREFEAFSENQAIDQAFKRVSPREIARHFILLQRLAFEMPDIVYKNLQLVETTTEEAKVSFVLLRQFAFALLSTTKWFAKYASVIILAMKFGSNIEAVRFVFESTLPMMQPLVKIILDGWLAFFVVFSVYLILAIIYKTLAKYQVS
jgi:predicted unusual protein kinase regulating ubiquinone biosynthesis (AarF/ABC1/UbiB family)